MPTTSPMQSIPLPEATDPDNVPGDLAAAVNSLETRTVMRFTSTAGRNAAIPNPTQGMLTTVSGTGRVERYDGTAWRPLSVPVLADKAALSTIATPQEGLIVTTLDGALYRYESGVWRDLFEWIPFTPSLYGSMLAGMTPTPIAGNVVYAKYRRIGKLVYAHAEIIASAGSADGGGISLPVPAVRRLINIGTAGIMGSPALDNQSGLACMGPQTSNDKLVFMSWTHGYLNFSAGHEIRYSVVYEAA